MNLAIVAITSIISIIAFNKPELLRKLMFNPYQVKHRKEYYRVISHAFIHADYIHAFFNMYVLYSFGGLIEQIFTNPQVFNNIFPQFEFWGTGTGYIYFILLYFGGIMFATLPSFRKHADDPSYNSLGASGAVSAVVMAIIILLPTIPLRFIFIPIDIPAFVMGILYLAYEFYMNKRGGTGIAHDAHIWGALFGLAFIIVINYRFALNFLNEIGIYIGL